MKQLRYFLIWALWLLITNTAFGQHPPTDSENQISEIMRARKHQSQNVQKTLKELPITEKDLIQKVDQAKAIGKNVQAQAIKVLDSETSRTLLAPITGDKSPKEWSSRVLQKFALVARNPNVQKAALELKNLGIKRSLLVFMINLLFCALMIMYRKHKLLSMESFIRKVLFSFAMILATSIGASIVIPMVLGGRAYRIFIAEVSIAIGQAFAYTPAWLSIAAQSLKEL